MVLDKKKKQIIAGGIVAVVLFFIVLFFGFSHVTYDGCMLSDKGNLLCMKVTEGGFLNKMLGQIFTIITSPTNPSPGQKYTVYLSPSFQYTGTIASAKFYISNSDGTVYDFWDFLSAMPNSCRTGGCTFSVNSEFTAPSKEGTYALWARFLSLSGSVVYTEPTHYMNVERLTLVCPADSCTEWNDNYMKISNGKVISRDCSSYKNPPTCQRSITYEYRTSCDAGYVVANTDSPYSDGIKICKAVVKPCDCEFGCDGSNQCLPAPEVNPPCDCEFGCDDNNECLPPPDTDVCKDCEFGCENGVCLHPTGECSEDSECNTGGLVDNPCFTNKCVSGLCEVRAKSCGSGKFCEAATGDCKASMSCVKNSDCVANKGYSVVCDNKKCVYTAVGVCRTYLEDNDGTCVLSLDALFSKDGLADFVSDYQVYILVVGLVLVGIIVLSIVLGPQQSSGF
jgi:hypothetical protein